MGRALVVLVASSLLLAACSGDRNPCACDAPPGSTGPQRLPLMCATTPLPQTVSAAKAVSCPAGSLNVYLSRGCGFTKIGTSESFTAYSGFIYAYDAATEQLVAHYTFTETPFGACEVASYAYGDRRAFDPCPDQTTCVLCGSASPELPACS